MIGWRASIRPASFRGVQFGVTSADLEAGRRTVLHEFPQRDEPYLEDMGAAPFKFTLEAFVIGSDYLSRRDELEKALQDPEPGTLVHPWYGEVEVAQFAPYKVRHSAQDGGMCVFSLSFARTEKPQSPSASVNPSLRCLLSADIAGALACDLFDNAVSFVSETAYVIQQSVALYQDAVGIVESVINGDFSRITGIFENLLGVPGAFSLGLQLWDAFASLFSDSGSDSDISAEKKAASWAKVACAAYKVPDPPHAGSARQTIRKNGLAFVQLVRSVAAIEACKAAVSAAPASRTAAQTLKNDIVAAFDAALEVPRPQYQSEFVENLGNFGANISGSEISGSEITASGFSSSDASAGSDPKLQTEFIAAFTEMRGYALAALASAAKRAPEVEIVKPASVQPALVVAYRYSGKSSLASDLVNRNGIAHPGFAPVAPLEVLSD